MPDHEFPPNPPTQICQHESSTCEDCLQQWCTFQIDNGYQYKMNCPDCGEECSARRDLQKFQGYNRYPQIGERIFRDKNPDWHWCMNPSCDSSQQHISPKQGSDEEFKADVFKCKECQAEDCVTCDRPMHTGITCPEYARKNMARLVEERVGAKGVETLKMQGNSKTCPNCGYAIEKYGPSRNVVCARCHYGFEWEAV